MTSPSFATTSPSFATTSPSSASTTTTTISRLPLSQHYRRDAWVLYAPHVTFFAH
jgi:hypothetical protein